jgi:hypothetical protein
MEQRRRGPERFIQLGALQCGKIWSLEFLKAQGEGD